MVSLAARSATVGFPEHTTRVNSNSKRHLCEYAHMCVCIAHVDGEWNLRRIDISRVPRLFILLEFIRDHSFARESLLINILAVAEVVLCP